MGCQASGAKVAQEPETAVLSEEPIDVFLRYEFCGLLGTGATSQVHRAVHRKSKESFVVKCFVKEEVSSFRDRDLKREVTILTKLDHENICRLKEAFEDSLISYFVLEPCMGGKLFDRLEADIVLEEDEAARVAREMASAASYIHRRGIIHRDMKPENWLISEQGTEGLKGQMKLGNFGIAQLCKPEESLTEPCGTLHYVAPEVLRGSYCHPMDMWTLGVVVFLTIYATYPFDGESCQEVIQSILGSDPDWSDSCYALSTVALDFLKKALCKDPAKRITPAEALKHQWLAHAGADNNRQSGRGSRRVTRPSLRNSTMSGGLVVGKSDSYGANVNIAKRTSLTNQLPQINGKGAGNRRISVTVNPDIQREAAKLTGEKYKKSNTSGHLDAPIPRSENEEDDNYSSEGIKQDFGKRKTAP